MKPEDLNKIHNVDCLEFIKGIPDGCIDLVVTDPPYGDGTGYGRMDKEIANNEDESINYKIIPELYRVLKDNSTMYLFTNWKFAGKLQEFIEKETEFTIRTMIVIVKNNIGMGYGFRNQHELCWVCEKGKVTYDDAGFSNVQKMENINHDKETHPHQKGIEMLARMIKHSSKEGGVILDCFAGSGSVCVAAKMCDRNYIGCELDATYCQMANDRITAISNTLF